MIQAAVGDCESWRRIWMAPRLADVTGRTAARQAAYRPAAERWPAHEAGLRELFVLGE